MPKRFPDYPESSFIDPTAHVETGVYIGENVYIGPFCRIGLPAEYHDESYLTARRGWVYIGDGSILTGNVCVDSGKDRITYIGAGVMLMSNVHIGHCCHIRDGVTIAPGAVVGGLTSIEEKTWIGINASIHQRSEIPAKCVIGAGAVLTKKHWGQLEEGQAYAGNPARHIGVNKKWATKHDVPLDPA